MGKTGYEHPGRFCFNFLKILYLLDIETKRNGQLRTISTPNEQTELVFSDEGYGQTY